MSRRKSDKEPLTKERPRDFGATTSEASDQPEQKSTEMSKNKYEEWVMPLIAEFVGQLLFAFMHSMAAQSVPIAASAINDGLFVAIMVITIGHISGAHVNSAVTIAVTLAGGLKWVMAPLYIAVQLCGSLAGAGLARVAFGQATGYFALGPGVGAGQGVLTEIMMSIVLVFAVLQAAVDLGSPIAAFAIGFAIVIDIFIGAKISGACMNPSLSFGPAVVAGAWDNYWIYWVGPITGALIAVALNKLLLGSRQKRILFNTEEDGSDSTSMKRQDGGEGAQSQM